jgi:hypothetical protein
MCIAYRKPPVHRWENLYKVVSLCYTVVTIY